MLGQFVPYLATFTMLFDAKRGHGHLFSMFWTPPPCPPTSHPAPFSKHLQGVVIVHKCNGW